MSWRGTQALRLPEAHKLWVGMITAIGSAGESWPAQRYADFGHELARGGRFNFPIEHASAQAVAKAFRTLGERFADPATAPENREALLPVLKAAALALDNFLTADARRMARLRGYVEGD